MNADQKQNRDLKNNNVKEFLCLEAGVARRFKMRFQRVSRSLQLESAVNARL
jgi:hypothetical protein